MLTILGSCRSEKKDPEPISTEIDAEQEPVDSPRIETGTSIDFAGSYTIEEKGKFTLEIAQMYTLYKNGRASWLYLRHGADGAVKVEDKRSGSWTATANGVTIEVEGKLGTIKEVYEMRDNRLTNVDEPEMYLKKTDK
ncbi:MAG: hypothetical protein KJO23_06560 [Bacteroidia bacterium]|nr:hypothetical protein [Bacteroidia bacterium]NNM23585.1 hypothetical protein [Flavobacteriaceae bacterium]